MARLFGYIMMPTMIAGQTKKTPTRDREAGKTHLIGDLGHDGTSIGSSYVAQTGRHVYLHQNLTFK